MWRLCRRRRRESVYFFVVYSILEPGCEAARERFFFARSDLPVKSCKSVPSPLTASQNDSRVENRPGAAKRPPLLRGSQGESFASHSQPTPRESSCRPASRFKRSAKHLSTPPLPSHKPRAPSQRPSSPRANPPSSSLDTPARERSTSKMATIALPTLRQMPRPAHQLILSLFRSSPSPLPSLALSAPALPTYALPSLANLVSDTLAGLRDLLPPILWAAPKSRTTHGAKRMRSAHKGLKEKQSAFYFRFLCTNSFA